ncbi:hypothetical protein A3F00_02205 [Candidatus Daviesbacteria bacterium RIFCSPHIGHO2_12_FULL_37_11]|uniref:Uncharacterized protein n=1 Tax=Candidatus Daviesbacteria bacterium RIFCSPHIGHO2_12_FULL_37_11 TaxID=1797777 RepID=A0A1F5KCF4_9BACT|nr:MAG: hypothetical protein A2769_01870 [Candidatus Daviesbacteria bacterium RIFCSPHIGHO2_01_FULL_37_27]OGE38626.1 MAG: hypothetical protein A3F00_02205 [Candidatus Daviesbacteria bacterium RIFCSPHIGHO2_12_FULL_37_11]
MSPDRLLDTKLELTPIQQTFQRGLVARLRSNFRRAATGFLIITGSLIAGSTAYADGAQQISLPGFINACDIAAGPADLIGIMNTSTSAIVDGSGFRQHFNANLHGRTASGLETTLILEFNNVLGSAVSEQATGLSNTGGRIDLSKFGITNNAKGVLTQDRLTVVCIGRGL